MHTVPSSRRPSAIAGTRLLLCLLLPACPARSKPEQLDRLMRDHHEEGRFNGAIVVAERGEVVYQAALGSADLRDSTPLTADSAFYVASLAKPFTAMDVMLLQQRGALNYDDTLAEHLPQLPPYTRTITLRNLLNHTSGLKDYERDMSPKPGLDNRDVLRWLSAQDGLDFPPGQRHAYSNSGYVLLSLIVEQVSHESYAAFTKRSIFDPLGMSHTVVYDVSRPTIAERAIGFDAAGELDDYAILTTGDGGVYSTTGDLLLWDQALRNNTLVSQAALDEAFARSRLNDGSFASYGLGWMLHERDDERAAFHTGGLNGFHALIWRDLTHQNTLILLSNQGPAMPMKRITDEVLGILAAGSLRYP